MTPLDGFLMGGFLCALCTIALLGAIGLATRRRAVVLEQRRRDQGVRLAFWKLAMQMREADRRSRVKQDMPWADRMKEAQAATYVNLGIVVQKATAA